MAEVALDHAGAMERRCNARSRQTGEPCRKPAGWGCPTKFGRCKLHGGLTPTGKAQAAKLCALAELGPMGGEVDANPLDALLFTVRRSSGLATYYRMQAEAAAIGGEDPASWAALERGALGDLARWAKMAIDAGVAERMVRIAEGTGERLASALEDALEGVELAAGQRQAIVQRFAGSLARLEREQPAIPARASDA